MKKKILLVSNMFPSSKNPEFGTFVGNIYKGLSSLNYDVDKVVINQKHRSLISKAAGYISFYILIIKQLVLHKYDYVYIHYISHSSLPVIFVRKLGFEFTVVSHIHGGDVKLLKGYNSFFFRLKKKIVSLSIKNSNVLVCPSKSYGEYVRSKFTINNDTSMKIYPSGGVSETLFANDISISRQPRLIGYAGRLISSKNINEIIRAMPDLNAQLEIVGSGSDEDSLKLLVSKLDLKDKVTFCPPMSQDDLALWYKKIDILVYPSDSESLGLVPIEAIASRAQVILSDIPAFRELFDLGLRIELLDAITPANIAHSVNKLLEKSKEKRSSDCDFNSVIIFNNYSHSVAMELLNEIFQK